MMSIAEQRTHEYHWIKTIHAHQNGVQLMLTGVFCVELGILHVF
jgi:hypothetical protein